MVPLYAWGNYRDVKSMHSTNTSQSRRDRHDPNEADHPRVAPLQGAMLYQDAAGIDIQCRSYWVEVLPSEVEEASSARP